MDHVEVDVRRLPQGPDDLRRDVCRLELLHRVVRRGRLAHVAVKADLAAQEGGVRGGAGGGRARRRQSGRTSANSVPSPTKPGATVVQRTFFAYVSYLEAEEHAGA